MDSQETLEDEHVPDTGWPEAVRDALVPFLVWRTVLFGTAAFVNSYLLVASVNSALRTTGPSIFWLPWHRFDSSFYIGIAEKGYSASSGPEWAFYPLYPYVVRVLAAPFGGGHTASIVVGVLVANLAAIGAALVLYFLVRAEWGRDVARRTSLYFALFPLGFYLSADYAESLFVLLCVSTLALTRQHRWLAAGAVGALAAATRPPGITLTAVLVCELFFLFRENRKAGYGTYLLRPLAGIALVPLGLVAFLALGKQVTGDWLVTFHVNADVWGRKLAFPWESLGSALRHPLIGHPENYLFQPLNLTIVVLWVVALCFMVRRFPPTYTVYTAALLVLSICSSTLQSLGRQVLPLVPVLVLLALWTRSESSNRHQLVMVGFSGLCTVFLVLYVLQIPAIA